MVELSSDSCRSSSCSIQRDGESIKVLEVVGLPVGDERQAEGAWYILFFVSRVDEVRLLSSDGGFIDCVQRSLGMLGSLRLLTLSNFLDFSIRNLIRVNGVLNIKSIQTIHSCTQGWHGFLEERSKSRVERIQVLNSSVIYHTIHLLSTVKE